MEQRPETYADIRIGAELQTILLNLKRFAKMRKASHYPKPEIGIAFVAMKRNVADLPAVLRIGQRLSATRFSVTNVLPYTKEMCAEALYPLSLGDISDLPSPWSPEIIEII